MLGVSLCSFGGVLLGLRGMAMRDQCVMGSLFDRTSFGVFGELPDGAPQPLYDAQQRACGVLQSSVR